jgi:hypothetical protein
MAHASSSIFSFQLGGKDTFLDTFHYLPKNDREKEAGELMVVFEFLDHPGAEDAIAHAVYQTLRDVFYTNTKRDVFDRFEDSLREVNAVLENESNKRESGSLGRISACIGLLQGKVVHFAQCGEGAVYIYRERKFSRISEPGENEAQVSGHDVFVNISSGELTEGDAVFFTTYDVLDDITKEDVRSALETVDDGEKVTKNFKALLKQGKAASAAVMCLYMGMIEAQQVMDAVEQREKPVVKSRGARVVTDKVFGLVKSFGGKVSDKTKGLLKKAKKPTPQYEKKSVFTDKRRYILAGLISAIGILIIVLVIRGVNNADKAKLSEYGKLLSETRSNLNIAEQRFLIGEKQDAQEFLSTAEKQVQDILATGFFRQEANKLLDDIAKYRDTFDSIFRVAEPFVVADLGAKTPDVESLGMVHTKDDKNYVYEYNMLYETLLDKVQEPLVIDEEEVVVSGWEFEDNNSLVFTSQSGQVIEFKDGAFTRMGTDDPQWHPGSEIRTYSRYIYVLDNESGKIWKYQRLRDKYSVGQAYNLESDLRSGVSFAIDGDVYVLMKDGTIKKFRKGEEQRFEVRTQPSVPVTNPTKIYTHPEIVNLYVLDPQNHRVVVYGKDNNGIADYKRQFLFEGIEDMRDIYVDNIEKKLYILTKDKIYGADI